MIFSYCYQWIITLWSITIHLGSGHASYIAFGHLKGKTIHCTSILTTDLEISGTIMLEKWIMFLSQFKAEIWLFEIGSISMADLWQRPLGSCGFGRLWQNYSLYINLDNIFLENSGKNTVVVVAYFFLNFQICCQNWCTMNSFAMNHMTQVPSVTRSATEIVSISKSHISALNYDKNIILSLFQHTFFWIFRNLLVIRIYVQWIVLL